jgi:hypothetical protein
VAAPHEKKAMFAEVQSAEALCHELAKKLKVRNKVDAGGTGSKKTKYTNTVFD